MSENKKINWNVFLKYFIENDRFRQNPLLKTNDFIDYCKKRGTKTNDQELELLEKEGFLYPVARLNVPIIEEERIKFLKDGKEYWRPARFGLQEGETEIEKYVVREYSSQAFSKEYKENLLTLMASNELFHPSEKPFIPWSNFKGEVLEYSSEKVITFYSSFQIHSLRVVHALSEHKSLVRTRISDHDNLLRFLLTVQSVYIPHMKSGSRRIQLSNMEDGEWQELKRNFRLDAELSLLGLDVLFICHWYIDISRQAEGLLGGFSSDWAHLFRSIAWDKKDKLEGKMRLGIDYLQWAIMLKRILEEHLQRKVFEVDEACRLSPKNILEVDPCDRSLEKLPILRKFRADYFYDEKQSKDYFYDRNKRLFYLVNDFDLDYQPKVMLFVEGMTEETTLPILFEWYFGISPEDMGIEIINFRGVSQMLSTSQNAAKLRSLLIDLQREEKKGILSKGNQARLNKVIKELMDIDIVISNWTSFLSYNLEKWQIIPFFLSDDEGNIRHFLEAEKPIKFEGVNYDVPKRLRFLWGIDNSNTPFEGKDFEFANFTNEEISSAIEKTLGRKVEVSDIQELRSRGEGINKIEGVEGNKVAIGKELIQNLIKAYKETQEDSLLKRPLFGVISKVAELSGLNHLPTSRKQELLNKDVIRKWLSEK